ncbi:MULTISPECIES: transcriptional regulator [unclassified Arcicella]|uniref:winged helix-turn-helix domain-containing protein n=1 Tax=unclassified Arcicella TaxID=2644986 RepID=UPI002860B9DA|nr:MULTISPECIES: transcriptional regulator [unclassified Arcicella]MDR6563450.1 putative transcriptional regulator [Arcicella sp. BE51]MDR6813438.1 putative transcriptional regulator [Arcicella sp. BE140]MDR6824751.1 putative transcriptional regulator [Arcicella sp. BE139]
MKTIIDNINKSFENRVRLGIMSLLIVNDWVDFNEFKEVLNVTNGNLASHITALKKEKYIKIRKAFIGKKPHTSFQATNEGKQAFQEHLYALETLIKGSA